MSLTHQTTILTSNGHDMTAQVDMLKGISPVTTQNRQTLLPPYSTSDIYAATAREYDSMPEFNHSEQELSPPAQPSPLEKPIVIPQQTNLFFIKTFSPFARSYSPSLATLPKPITEPELLTFIDALNNAFISAPIFQAMHVVGGLLLATQVLPAQAVGGVFQVSSILGSAGISFTRVRKHMKAANATLFAPRGLTAKIMTTKKMMAAVGFTDMAVNGKLKLPPLNNLEDLEHTVQAGHISSNSTTNLSPQSPTLQKPEDPRVRRLQALSSYVAPLTFDVPEPQVPQRWITKVGNAPLKWANGRQMKKLDKAHAKSMKARDGKSEDAEREVRKSQMAVGNIDTRISHLRTMSELGRDGQAVEACRSDEQILKALEAQRQSRLDDTQKVMKDIYEKGDKKGEKKLEKLYKKEEKIVNRILWVVIKRREGAVDSDYLQVEE